MIAASLQAAAEYVGTMIANGFRALGPASRDVGRWLGDHPWEIGIAIVALMFLRMWRRAR